MASDRRSSPSLPARANYTFLVKPVGDYIRTRALCILFKYPNDDIGFAGIDIPQASDGLTVCSNDLFDRVAVANAARHPSLFCYRLHSFPRAISDLFQHLTVEDGPKAKFH